MITVEILMATISLCIACFMAGYELGVNGIRRNKK